MHFAKRKVKVKVQRYRIESKVLNYTIRQVHFQRRKISVFIPRTNIICRHYTVKKRKGLCSRLIHLRGQQYYMATTATIHTKWKFNVFVSGPEAPSIRTWNALGCIITVIRIIRIIHNTHRPRYVLQKSGFGSTVIPYNTRPKDAY